MEQKYIESLIKKIYATGTLNPKPHERIRTTRTPGNIARVSELICSRGDDLGTSKSPNKIQRKTGILEAP